MRKSKPKKRILLPDPVYNDPMVTRFVNNLMYSGKKTLSFNIFYDALAIVEKKTSERGIDVWKRALGNVMPSVEVKSRRVGGANFQIPTEVRPDRRNALATRWIITYARARADHSFAEKFAQEIMAASRNEGGAVKKREDTHKMADANKAFSHYRW